MNSFQIFFANILVLLNIFEIKSNFLQRNNFNGLERDSNMLKRNIQERTKRSIRIRKVDIKWEFPIKYWIDPESDLNETIIDDALKDISDKTCITWKKESSEIFNTPGLNVRNRNLCASFTGRSSDNKSQEITFTPECVYKGRLQHEFSHALGLVHENRRPDSQNYIDISFDKVKSKDIRKLQPFESEELLSFNISYDYGSQLHADSKVYSESGSLTIKTKDPNYQNTIGQDTGLQYNDFKQLNLYYCGRICSDKKLKCKNGGYLYSKNCKKCSCPPHYGGSDCSKGKFLKNNCGKISLTAKSYKKTLKVAGIKKCYYYINTNSKYKIQLTIESSDLPQAEENGVCVRGKGLEVLYRKDPSVMGAMFCGNTKKVTMKSENNRVSIYYVGTNTTNFLEISYKNIGK
uniref:Metalloendopeptidase n=1 Tax=Strongyloides venezuelensis TaxID=75913 RepID=A0A0K0FZ20_STRVS